MRHAHCKEKGKVIKEAAIHDKDTGSPEVQIAVLSKRIDELTTHLKKNLKDKHSRRGLLQMVADRRTHLKYLETHDKKRHSAIVKNGPQEVIYFFWCGGRASIFCCILVGRGAFLF